MKAIEELAIERFRKAIPEHEQRMAVFRSKAKTLDQAVKAAIDAESWRSSSKRRKEEAANEKEGKNRQSKEVQTKPGKQLSVMEEMRLVGC